MEGTALTLVGFFQETHPFLIRGQRQSLPSFHDFVSETPQEHEEQIIRYLQSGEEYDYISSRPIYRTRADRARLDRTGVNLTDGAWTWPSELAYYVEVFHLRLPLEFIQHMEVSGWQPPKDIQVRDLVFPGAVTS